MKRPVSYTGAILLLLRTWSSRAFLVPSAAPAASPRILQGSHGSRAWHGLASASTLAETGVGSSSVSAHQTKKLIVLTREEGKNDKLRERLQQGQAADQVELMELPCIAHVLGEDHGSLGPTLDSQHFDYVVVTSPEAAHVFLDVVKTCSKYKPSNIVSIGEATGDILRKAGAEIIFSPSKSLAKVLGDELPPVEGRTTRVLYPASRRAANTLEGKLGGRGFEVVRLNTYDTVPAEWTAEETEKARGCEVVTFASPSALKVWTSRLGSEYKVACIGETTATAAREAGWSRIFYPSNPGLDGWSDSVWEAVQEK